MLVKPSEDFWGFGEQVLLFIKNKHEVLVTYMNVCWLLDVPWPYEAPDCVLPMEEMPLMSVDSCFSKRAPRRKLNIYKNFDPFQQGSLETGIFAREAKEWVIERKPEKRLICPTRCSHAAGIEIGCLWNGWGEGITRLWVLSGSLEQGDQAGTVGAPTLTALPTETQ